MKPKCKATNDIVFEHGCNFLVFVRVLSNFNECSCEAADAFEMLTKKHCDIVKQAGLDLVIHPKHDKLLELHFRMCQTNAMAACNH